MKKVFLLLLTAGSSLFACKHEVINPGDIDTGSGDTTAGSDCDTTVFTYSDLVKETMQNNCVGCHSTSFMNGGVDLSTYNGVQSAAVSGALMGTITRASGYPPMPQDGSKLSDCDITLIEKWITDGTRNN